MKISDKDGGGREGGRGGGRKGGGEGLGNSGCFFTYEIPRVF